MIPRILIIGASLGKNKNVYYFNDSVNLQENFGYLFTELNYNYDWLSYPAFVSMDETQLACTSKSDLLKPVFFAVIALFHSERKKPCGVPALYREA